MTEPEPLLESCFDEFELTLLRSTRRDAPPAHAARRATAALALGASYFATTAKASAMPAAAAAPGATSMAWVVCKFVAIGALSGTAVCVLAGQLPLGSGPANAAPALARGVEVQPPSARVASARTEAEETAPGLERYGHATEPALTGAHAPDAPHRTRVVSPAASGTPVARAIAVAPSPAALASFAPLASAASAPGASSIAEEVKLIDSARQALSNGRGDDALKDANAYLSRWPEGVLRMEALILRVKAELLRGDRVSAQRDASAVIAAQPGSRYAARLRALFDRAQGE